MPNPILKVLSTLGRHQVRYLLMGGQACVLYGGAEFSRDTDIAVLVESDNLQRLSAALAELQAECIAVPPFLAEYLQRGHAVHFRCQHSDALGMRVDVMAVMRGVAPFNELWPRRTTVTDEAGLTIELMSLPDLVQSKKTQRDKDWSMLRRLVEAHYARHRESPTPEHVRFWLGECRTASILLELCERCPNETTGTIDARPLLSLALAKDEAGLTAALDAEERHEREVDRTYWLPLRRELEELRHERSRQ